MGVGGFEQGSGASLRNVLGKINEVPSERARASQAVQGLGIEVDGSGKLGTGDGEGHGEVFPANNRVYLPKPEEPEDNGDHLRELRN